jgi:hypothetical protein
MQLTHTALMVVVVVAFICTLLNDAGIQSVSCRMAGTWILDWKGSETKLSWPNLGHRFCICPRLKRKTTHFAWPPCCLYKATFKNLCNCRRLRRPVWASFIYKSNFILTSTSHLRGALKYTVCNAPQFDSYQGQSKLTPEVHRRTEVNTIRRRIRPLLGNGSVNTFPRLRSQQWHDPRRWEANP